MALQKQIMQVPLAAGLNQKGDKRSQQPPFLDIAKDVQFDEAGGLQTRHPYYALGLSSDSGTIAAADCRRIVEYNNELLLFTKGDLFSYMLSPGTWSHRSEHLAAALSEEIVCSSNGDQAGTDRCILGGVEWFTWQEGTKAYVSARDATTKAFYISAWSLSTASRPRFVPCADRVLLFWVTGGGDLVVSNLNPNDVVTTVQGTALPTTVHAINAAGYYDVTVQIGGGLAIGAACLTTTTTYLAFTVTPSGSSVTVATSVKSRACVGVIAVASTRAATQMQVIRQTTSSTITGDLLTISSLADVNTSTAILSGSGFGDPTSTQLALCYPASVSSPEVCDIYYSGIVIYKGTINTSGTVVTPTERIAGQTLAARPFTRTGDAKTYIWTYTDRAPSGATGVQSQYQLFRSDLFLVARSRIGNVPALKNDGHLGECALTANDDEYAFLGGFMRAPTQNTNVTLQSIGTARAPRDVVVTFDSNLARRCAQLGKTLYVSGGMVLQYDGISLTESGFSTQSIAMQVPDSGSGGAIPVGTYSYENSWRSMNAHGESDRSASFGPLQTTYAGINKGTTTANIPTLLSTRKTNVAIEFWRTPVAPIDETPFYLASGNDPATTTGDNAYVANDRTLPNGIASPAWTDNLTDALLTVREQHPQANGTLEPIAPPPANIITSTADRLFLGDIAGLPNTVWYSFNRSDGLAARWNDTLVFQVPPTGGAMTGIMATGELIIVFRETAIYAFSGVGLDDTGGGANYELARIATVDVGAVNQESLVLTDSGIMFQSRKGWHLLDRSLSVQYIGDKIVSYDAETVEAANLVHGQHQMRIPTSGRVLVFDNYVGQWGEWTISDAIGACVWEGAHVYLSSSSGAMLQLNDYSGTTYGMDVETCWIKFNDLQGFGRIWKILILGEYRSACSLRIRIARDYESDGAGGWSYFDDKVWTVTPTTVGGPVQLRIGPSRQQCESIKVRITVLNADGVSAPTGESIKLTGLAFELGVKPHVYSRLPAAQKQ